MTNLEERIEAAQIQHKEFSAIYDAHKALRKELILEYYADHTLEETIERFGSHKQYIVSVVFHTEKYSRYQPIPTDVEDEPLVLTI